MILGTPGANEVFHPMDIWAFPSSFDAVQYGTENMGDHLNGGALNDALYGFGGKDVLYGNGGDDYLSGGVDDDFLDGGIGNDWLEGGDGDDSLSGSNGNDVIKGGHGNDVMTGGQGADLFVMSKGDGTDTIVDFGAGDVLHLEGVNYSYSDFWGSGNKPVTCISFISHTGYTTRIGTNDGRVIWLDNVKAEQLHGHVVNGDYEWTL